VKTVVLTGFDDFKFAQQAIRFGVLDYILKPVLPKDIEELMEKLKSQLDSDTEKKENITKLREHYNESLPIIRDKFLTLMITGNSDEKEMKDKINFFNLRLNGSSYVVAAGSVENSTKEERIFDDSDTELMRLAVINIAREIADKHSMGEVFFHNNEFVMIFSLSETIDANMDNNETIFKKVYSVLEEIRQNVEKFLKLIITIGIGSRFNSLTNLNASYKSALSALEYKLVIGDNRIIFIEDLEPKRKEIVGFNENKERLLVTAIKFGREKEVSQVVEQLFTELQGTKAAFKDYQLYFVEIVAAISKVCRDFEIDTSEILGISTNLYVEILEFNTFNEIRVWVEGICIKLMNFISSSRKNTTQLLLKKAQDYILQNYSDDEISIQKVSNYLHISSSYLSMIFKKEADQTFLKYLVKVRLDAAIELLNQTFKIAEIAERIGYPDINYFSYFFKKNYGMSPREYRNKYVNKKESLGEI